MRCASALNAAKEATSAADQVTVAHHADARLPNTRRGDGDGHAEPGAGGADRATLSFLGVGMPPTEGASLGTLDPPGQPVSFGAVVGCGLPRAVFGVWSFGGDLLERWLRDALNPVCAEGASSIEVKHGKCNAAPRSAPPARGSPRCWCAMAASGAGRGARRPKGAAKWWTRRR